MKRHAGHGTIAATGLGDRFWDKVDKSGECWLWIATITGGGYGYYTVTTKKKARTHRLSYAEAYGPIPEGVSVLHFCDVRACVRPSHLFLGSYQDNMLDMVAKGRHSVGDRKGSKNPLAVLTEATVISLRDRYAAGGISQRKLVRELGISQQTVSEIVTRKIWTHV